MIKVVAFDVFGTVLDSTSVDASDLIAYVDATREAQLSGEPWRQLRVPQAWHSMPARVDAKLGIERLRKHFRVVTCSNLPIDMIVDASKHNGIDWDFITPVELRQEWKPAPGPYRMICEAMRVEPSEVAFVTANKTFGDLEASAALGMRPFLIRGDELPTIHALADLLISEAA